MSDENTAGELSGAEVEVEVADTPQVPRQKAIKVLPTDRLSFEKQLAILRAYAAASGPSANAVSNLDVEKVSGTSASSISICNPFFNDVGLIIRDGNKQRPSKAVFDYAHSYDWDAAHAAHKLGQIINGSWFSEALLPKLAFRSLNKAEAVNFLADESKAAPSNKKQLELLIEYLDAAGLIRVEGDQLSKAQRTKQPTVEPQGTGSEKPPGSTDTRTKSLADEDRYDVFKIPIPGKDEVEIGIPKNLDIQDWAMLELMLKAYVVRLKNWKDADVSNAKNLLEKEIGGS